MSEMLLDFYFQSLTRFERKSRGRIILDLNCWIAIACTRSMFSTAQFQAHIVAAFEFWSFGRGAAVVQVVGVCGGFAVDSHNLTKKTWS